MRLPLTGLRPAAADLPLDRAGIMRFLGYRPGVTRLMERHTVLVDRGIAMALHASEPAASIAYCGIEVSDNTVSTRVPGLTWRSRSLARLLKKAVGVSLVAATLGPGIEQAVERLFREEEYALAAVADAAGSVLVQALGEWLRSYLQQEGHGRIATALFGPGYGDWDIYDQAALTAAAGGDDIGIMSTEACYLVPQKSLVGVIGWLTPGVGTPAAGPSGCVLCTMPDCAYRIKGS